jgi:hypothetical protein
MLRTLAISGQQSAHGLKLIADGCFENVQLFFNKLSVNEGVNGRSK